jgi:putative chitinase
VIPVLVAAGADPARAALFAPHLQAILPRYGITTPERVAGFVGQVVIESAGLRTLEEGLTYTTTARLRAVWPSRFPSDAAAAPFVRNPQALADFVYAGRNGNGPQASGDGWRFRGRGLKQLTGRANYASAARQTGRPYVEQPDLVAQPMDAVLTAAVFWAGSGCSAAADAQDWDAVTRAVNGPAMLQRAERAAASRAALRALAVA